MQVSDVLVLAGHCMLVNFIFQIFPVFNPEMPADFTWLVFLDLILLASFIEL
jgi:hypothetical protein